MIEPRRVLAPLDAAEGAIERLSRYEGAAELGGAVSAVWDAVDRSLRLLLRSDRGATDPIRLAALSRDDLSFTRVIEELRQRSLVTMELAGSAHELEQAEKRAARGEVRAADADLALAVVERLRREVNEAAERTVRNVAKSAVRAGALEEEVHEVPSASSGAERRLGLVAVIVAAVIILVVAIVLVRSWSGPAASEAIQAFQAGQLQVAEARFRDVVRRQPNHVTAHLYLGRIYRRQQRFESASEALRTAAQLAPDDPGVNREIGYLFLDLNRPAQAVDYFQRAVEIEPQERLNWFGLVRALREAGDLRAEEVLRRAPADVRATLGGAGDERAP